MEVEELKVGIGGRGRCDGRGCVGETEFALSAVD